LAVWAAALPATTAPTTPKPITTVSRMADIRFS
jgi:hypothetical protein